MNDKRNAIKIIGFIQEPSKKSDSRYEVSTLHTHTHTHTHMTQCSTCVHVCHTYCKTRLSNKEMTNEQLGSLL